MLYPRGSGAQSAAGGKKAAPKSQPAKNAAPAKTENKGGAGKAGADSAAFNESDRAQGGTAEAKPKGSVQPAKSESKKAEEKKELGTKDEKGDVEVHIEMDPAAPECADDKYTLYGADGRFRKVMTVKDDQTPGDRIIQLVFKDVPGGTTYTMEVDPGAEGKPYNLFETIPFQRLIAAAK